MYACYFHLFFKHRLKLKGLFDNFQTVVGDINNRITLTCNSSSSNQTITWIKSADKVNTYVIGYGEQIVLNNLGFSDSEYYYSCDNGLSGYYLIVRSN